MRKMKSRLAWLLCAGMVLTQTGVTGLAQPFSLPETGQQQTATGSNATDSNADQGNVSQTSKSPLKTANANTGDFSVGGGTPGTDYTFADGILTVENGAALTISGTVASGGIVIADDAKASVTIENLNLTAAEGSAVSLRNGSVLNLTIEGTNTLSGSGTGAGIHVPFGAELTISEKPGTGRNALDVTGGDGGGAAIGAELDGDTGTIRIHGGDITAHGSGGAAALGQGGKESWGGYVEIYGGHVLATDSGAGIRADGISISNAIVDAVAVRAAEVQKENCILNGVLYGSWTFTEDWALNEGEKLRMPKGSVLTIAEGAKLTNCGDIFLEGGTLTVNGTYEASGEGKVFASPDSVIDGAGAASVRTESHASEFPFQVSPATLVEGEDYRMENGRFSILTDKPITLSGKDASGLEDIRIVVESGTVNLTMENLVMEKLAMGDKASLLEVSGEGTTLNLTLSGENVLKTGDWTAGIHVGAGAALYIGGSGTLELNGNADGAVSSETPGGPGTLWVRENTAMKVEGTLHIPEGGTLENDGMVLLLGNGTLTEDGAYTGAGTVYRTSGEAVIAGSKKEAVNQAYAYYYEDTERSERKVLIASKETEIYGFCSCESVATIVLKNLPEGTTAELKSATGSEIAMSFEISGCKKLKLSANGITFLPIHRSGFQIKDTSVVTLEISGENAIGGTSAGNRIAIRVGNTLSIVGEGRIRIIGKDGSHSNDSGSDAVLNEGTLILNAAEIEITGGDAGPSGQSGWSGGDAITGTSGILEIESCHVKLTGGDAGQEGSAWGDNERLGGSGAEQREVRISNARVEAQGGRGSNAEDGGTPGNGGAGLKTVYSIIDSEVTSYGGEGGKAVDGTQTGDKGEGITLSELEGTIMNSVLYTDALEVKNAETTIEGSILCAESIEKSGWFEKLKNYIEFLGEKGSLYGSLTLPFDFEVGEGKTLTISENNITTFDGAGDLTIPEGKTLTNRGTIVFKDGHKIVNNGTFRNSGTVTSEGVTGEVENWNNSQSTLTITQSGESVTKDVVAYGSTITLTAKVTEKPAVMALSRAVEQKPNTADFYLENEETSVLLNKAPVDVVDGVAKLELSLTSKIWKPGSYTIKAVYHGSDELLETICETALTVTKGTSSVTVGAPVIREEFLKDTSLVLEALHQGGPGSLWYAYKLFGEEPSDSDWKTYSLSSPEITGLEPATQYTFYIKYAGNDYYDCGESFEIGEKSVWTRQETPEKEEGYSVDYVKETATPEAGFEIRQEEDGPYSPECLTVEPGKPLYVRRSASEEIPPSISVENPLPVRPVLSGVKGENTSFAGEKDGTISGLSAGGVYLISRGSEGENFEAWEEKTAETDGRISGFEAGAYRICKKGSNEAGQEAFRSEPVNVTIGSGEERTYTLNLELPVFGDLTYGYGQAEAGTMKISNAGNSTATIASVTADNGDWIVGQGENQVPSGGSIETWTLCPAAGLPAGTHPVEITVTYNDGATAKKKASVTVKKAGQDAPASPRLESKDEKSVTLAAEPKNQSGAEPEYSINGLIWQKSPVFTGLAPETEYRFYLRYGETENYLASPAGEALVVVTDEETETPPVVPGGGEDDKPSGGEGDKPSGGEGDKPSGGEGDKPSGGENDKPSGGNGGASGGSDDRDSGWEEDTAPKKVWDVINRPEPDAEPLPETEGQWFRRPDGDWGMKNPSGQEIRKDWVVSNQSWYYIDENGSMATGLKEIGGKYYFFLVDQSGEGKLLVGWTLWNGKWYYGSEERETLGEVRFGWLKIRDKWYYFGTDGVMLINTRTPDGYFVGPDGAWIPGL